MITVPSISFKLDMSSDISSTTPFLPTGMLIVMLPHFTIPLILRKSDGGYGYDSTDMAAMKYRLFDLKRDWIIYVTDEGQSGHFHMCFDAAKASNWVKSQRLDHIGFGVVCGDDGTTISLIHFFSF